MHISDQSCNLLLQREELVFKGVYGVQILAVHLVLSVVIVGSGILRHAISALLCLSICRVALVSILPGLSVNRAALEGLLGDQPFDGPLCIPDPSRELRSLHEV